MNVKYITQNKNRPKRERRYNLNKDVSPSLLRYFLISDCRYGWVLSHEWYKEAHIHHRRYASLPDSIPSQ